MTAAAKYQGVKGRDKATRAEIALAREMYADDNVAIDNDAAASRNDGREPGLWVQAWVWVPTLPRRKRQVRP